MTSGYKRMQLALSEPVRFAAKLKPHQPGIPPALGLGGK
jgi:hypothetical protein